MADAISNCSIHEFMDQLVTGTSGQMLVNIPYMKHMGDGGYHFVRLKNQGPSAPSSAGGCESFQWRSCLKTSRRAIADMVNVDILLRKIAMFNGKTVENYGKLWKIGN